MPGVGHNSGADTLNRSAQDQLKAFIERAETIIDNEINPAREALKDVFAEAKGAGFDPAAMRKLIALRAKDRAKVQEANTILALYAHAIGCEDLV
jgi:uncharacterized protein (UPF0335 family)